MSVVWGVSYLFIKVAVTGVSVPVLVFARTAIGAAVLLPLAVRERAFASVRAHWKPLVAFATLEMVVPWWLLSDAERTISSGLAGLLIAASPIITVLVARIAGDNERMSAGRLAGLGLGFAGLVVLAAPSLRGGSGYAILEVLVTAVCYATAPVIAARKLGGVPPMSMTAACLSFASVLYVVPAGLAWPSALPAPKVLAALGGLAIVCTAVAFIAFLALIREVGSSRALVFTYVNPAVAVTAGVLLLGEPLTPEIVVAFVLILAGSVLATGRRSKAAPEVAPEPERELVPACAD
jgi:drug/metabolite transporter (DMT)-like permease